MKESPDPSSSSTKEEMIVLIMGVAGSGKTTIGRALSRILHVEFFDGDILHSKQNRQKMAQGIPLTDQDRSYWLSQMRKKIQLHLHQRKSLVIACSALKESYRKQLLLSKKVKLVYLKGSRSLIENRIKQRKGHFFAPHLLASQFEILEEPNRAMVVSIERSVQEIVKVILDGLST